MFNSYSNNQSFNFDINAVSGTLRKSHPKSKMMIRTLKDSMHCFNNDKPFVDTDHKEEIVILQTMLIGDNKALIEYVDKEDFEEGSAKQIEREIYVVNIIEPARSFYHVFTNHDEALQDVVKFTEYMIRKVFPKEYGNIEFKNFTDIYSWATTDKHMRKLDNKFDMSMPGGFRYKDGEVLYSAVCEKHNITIDLDKEE